MLDYAHHWTTQGATTKRVILRAFEQVAEVEEEAASRPTRRTTREVGGVSSPDATLICPSVVTSG